MLVESSVGEIGSMSWNSVAPGDLENDFLTDESDGAKSGHKAHCIWKVKYEAEPSHLLGKEECILKKEETKQELSALDEIDGNVRGRTETGIKKEERSFCG